MYTLRIAALILLILRKSCAEVSVENDEVLLYEKLYNDGHESLIETLEKSVINDDTLIVHTRAGKIMGTIMESAVAGKSFYAFLGIPYALPPIGELRFKGKKHSLPVVVFIHGGGFIMGYSNYSTYGPDFLLNNDVVFVSFNYRLGAFGFLATEDLVVPGNNGLKDQLLALKWIKKNIAAFGGNPSKITIMGQSAGAASVGYLLQSPLAKGLFKVAVLLSGNTLSPWSLQRNPRNIAFRLGQILSINTTSSEDLISKLRDKLATEIVAATLELIDAPNILAAMVFLPVREPRHKGSFFSDRSYRMLSEEYLNAAYIMIGYTSAEAGEYFTGIDNNLFSDPDFLVPDDMNVNASDKLTVASKIMDHYFADSFAPIDIEKIKFGSDNYFVRPAVKYMELASKTRNKVYGYEFTYQGEFGFPNRAFDGVTHGEDIAYIFKNENESTILTWPDMLTRERWCKFLTNFAWYGNPTPKLESIFENLNWKMVSQSKDLFYLEFGEHLTMRTKPHYDDMKFWNDLYLNYGNQQYDTY